MTMNRFGKHKWWMLTALLSAPLVALAAGVPNMFAPNTPISSAAVNANFTDLANRVTALENAKTTVTLVMDNVIGGLGATGKTATFTSAGGTVVLVVSGTGWINGAGGVVDVAIQLDGNVIGHLKTTTNEMNSHKAFPARAIPVSPLAAGTHTIGLLNGTGTTTDGSDFFNVTAIEFGH
jgi:hypothetical protein